MPVQLKLPALYTNPTTQIVLVGITCFATVGMFSAVSNLGAGGTQDVALSDTANGVLYGTFALAGLISGGINNLLGPRLTLFIGTLGYALYVGALWCFQTQGTRWFLIFAGAVLGFTAALLWSAQGAIMMSYPLEKDKGKAFSIFWAIFQFGTFLGSLIALAINVEKGQLTAVSNSTYVAFIIIIFVGIASAFVLLPPNRVVRPDGTLVTLSTHTSLRTELHALLSTLKSPKMLALLPTFFASNYFYAYQGALNTAKFDGPTRALNATLEGAGAIVGALMIGYLVLDQSWGGRVGRRARGFVGLATVAAVTIIVWACGLGWQVTFTRESIAGMENPYINYKQANYRGKGALFFFYYFGDACYQALTYWVMSALTNDPFTLARYAGLYKAVQSAGAAGSFGMDAVGTPFLNELLASWVLMLVSFVPMGWVVWGVRETNYGEEKVIYATDVHPTDTDTEKGVPAPDLPSSSSPEPDLEKTSSSEKESVPVG